MSAETLRRAAALIRERAEAARAGRWVAEAEYVLAQWTDVRHVAECSGSIPEGNDANARHIASWHPAVALAVADWLEAQAALHESFVADGLIREWDAVDTDRSALTVARTYLGESS